VREGRRSEFEAFGWNPDEIPDPNDPRSFERSKLDWGEIDQPAHRAMLDRYRSLLALHRRLPAFTAPVGEDVDVQIDGSGAIRFRRPGVSVAVDTRYWSAEVHEERG